jgi:hypothetical protein
MIMDLRPTTQRHVTRAPPSNVFEYHFDLFWLSFLVPFKIFSFGSRQTQEQPACLPNLLRGRQAFGEGSEREHPHPCVNTVFFSPPTPDSIFSSFFLRISAPSLQATPLHPVSPRHPNSLVKNKHSPKARPPTVARSRFPFPEPLSYIALPSSYIKSQIETKICKPWYHCDARKNETPLNVDQKHRKKKGKN